MLCQVTNYWIICKGGSLPPILGKTSTSRANHDTATPGCGLLRETHSPNGRIRVRARCYGSMGNVSCRPALTSSQRLMPFPVLAGAGKSVLWYVDLSIFLSWGLTIWLVPPSSRISRLCRNLGSRHLRYFTMTSGRIGRGTSPGYSHPCYSSCAISPTPTTMYCPHSIRQTAMVHRVQATTNLSSV